jgi:anti-sigma factor RsiW
MFDFISRLFRRPLNCEQANAFILDYLENRLDAGTRTQFESHLTMCPGCAPFFEQYKQTIQLVHDDGQLDIPADLTAHALSFLREQGAGTSR